MAAGTHGPDDDVPARFQVDFTGELLLGLYRVERRLAEGGMGSVYLAQDTNLGRRVVVKVPHARFLGEPGFRARFRREIEELVRLEHPHVARILARGEADGVPFFVLQFLGGGSLEDRLARGPQPAADAATWLEPIARTLDFVHAKGVVHRDVKPANILFDEGGHVFLSDFGVVKALGETEGADLTAVGTGIGSPVYMAPEQSMAKGVTAASDQYALASTLYEALSGDAPFGKGSVVEVLVRKGREEAAPLRAVLPDLPAAADAAVLRALARDPAARFPSCSAFAQAFRDGLAPSRPAPVSAPARARGPVLVAAALLVVALVAAALTRGFGLWAEERPEPASPPPAPTPEPGPEAEPPLLVRVVERGAEPRRRLLHTYTVGSRDARHLRTAHRQSIQMGAKPPLHLGGITEQDLSAEVTEVAADGTARLAWTFQPGVPLLENGATEDSVAMEKKINDALGVVTSTSRRSAAGVVLDVSVASEKTPPRGEYDLLAVYEELVRGAALPLPDVAVGVGAKWDVVQIKAAFGMSFEQRFSFELLESEGTRLVVRYRFSQEGPPQAPRIKDLPEGTRAVSSLQTTGEGTDVLDLGRALPVSSSGKGTVAFTMEVEGEADSPLRVEKTFEMTMTTP